MDKQSGLFYKQGFSLKLNRDTDPNFIYFDYDTRESALNMSVQHFHNHHEIFIPFEQSTAHVIDGRYWRLDRYDMCFLRPRLLHMSVYPKIDTPQRRLIINFSLANGIPGLEHYYKKLYRVFQADPPILRLPPDRLGSVHEVLNSIFQIGLDKSPGWEVAFWGRFMEFLWLANRNLEFNCYSPEEAVESTEQKIWQVTDYINQNYSGELSLEVTARRFDISPYYLSHSFKEVTGSTFVGFVQQVRVRNALQKLAYSDDWVGDVMADCGFTSASQFNRVFRKYLGMSPSDFRKSGRGKKEALMSTLSPENSESAPANLAPRFGISARKKKSAGVVHKIGVDAKDFGPMLPAVLRARIEAEGAETIQLSIPDCFPGMSYSKLNMRQLGTIKESNFDIAALECDIDLSSGDDEKWNADLNEFSNALRIAAELGAGCVSTGVGRGKPGRVAEALDRLLPIASSYGVPIAVLVAAHGPVATVDDAEKLLKSYRSPYLKIIFDPVAMLGGDMRSNTGYFFENAISRLEKWFAAVYLSDRLDGDPAIPGQGEMGKTLPYIARLLNTEVPVILVGAEPSWMASGLSFARKTFGGQGQRQRGGQNSGRDQDGHGGPVAEGLDGEAEDGVEGDVGD